MDYRSLVDKAHWIYLALLVSLLAVLVFGAVRGGSRRWLDLGVFNLQPSEFVKAGVALVLAKLLGESRRHGAVEPGPVPGQRADPGAAGARSPASPTWGRRSRCCRCSAPSSSPPGCRCATWPLPALVALVLAPIAWTFALEDYQKSRIVTFLDPEQDPRGAGYQQIQARITVGSGGVMGKGFMQGTQGQLRFLPVAHNDFIFSVLAEEQGFAGVVVALALYLFVIVRALDAARLSKDRIGAYLVLGVLASFTFQVVYNITMSAGLAPVKGLTLPLMSYGGSSMIATLAGFGLILNVRMRRFTN